MLHRAKLLRELESVSDKLFIDLSPQVNCAQKVWKQMVSDNNLAEKIAACQAPWPLPTWQGSIARTVSCEKWEQPYQLLSIDGSQVYPDKHQGTSCFLINIGTVILRYRTTTKGIFLNSVPTVFADRFAEFESDVAAGVDLVNCKREELELQAGFEGMQQLQEELPEVPALFLFDGSLIFWHLNAKEQVVKEHFLHSYCSILEKCAQKNMLLAGYISLPKSKDLINVMRTVLCGFDNNSKEYQKIDRLTDASLVSFFLKPGMRSIIFKSRSPITELYPESIAPHFFYYNAGVEIVRVEIPAYIANNETAVHFICGVIVDQIEKGAGFPVGVAEAHEQAVVKGPDREFFYHLIGKLGITHKKSFLSSQKSRKKRGIAV